ncbi:hypothetical protein NDU88_004502 [Pleurodeles waltl]|uniref:Uncharacterized protein n=1 Tax=Pleurodeles waltl TaxID=8319 RepID=A0AAV7TRN7_PLEWA|nr:hypothetical protein NDU88_004502 [Pleurodeles waltl]
MWPHQRVRGDQLEGGRDQWNREVGHWEPPQTPEVSRRARDSHEEAQTAEKKGINKGGRELVQAGLRYKE